MKIARSFFTVLFFTIAWFFPSIAHAMCGFYVAPGAAQSFDNAKLENDATRVVLMRDGTRTVLSMQNAYKGPPSSFALVVPVPVVLQKENVKVLSNDVFDRIDNLSAPRLVEYWEEDPCAPKSEIPPVDLSGVGLSNLGAVGGVSGAGGGPFGVAIEAKFEVGEYEIVILSAKDSSGLESWLKSENYKIPDGAEPFLRPYVQAGSKFFVAKVNAAKVHFENGRALLSPLRFHYDSEQFALPVRLGLLNSAGKQDLEVFILGADRYEVANAKNVTIPTNLDVNDTTKANFSAFYASLFDDTLAKNPGAVVTEYAWSASSCNPCPAATLTDAELATVGGDVIPSARFGPAPSVDANQRADVQVGAATSPIPIANVDRVLAGLRPKMRACYRKGLESDPTQYGKLSVVISVAASGDVEKADIAANTGMSQAVAACVSRAVRNATFNAPPAHTTITVPITFATDPPKSSDKIAPAASVLVSLPSFTLTRLHLRYTKDSLGDDLVFRVAKPLTGGHELRGQDGKLSTTSGERPKGASASEFQARYSIRHPWAGAMACTDPHRGRWVENAKGGKTDPIVAVKLATASRDVSFTSFLGDPSVGTPMNVWGADRDAGTLAPTGDASTSNAPSAVTKKRACGCDVVGDESSATLAPVLSLVAFAVAWARKKRRAN